MFGKYLLVAAAAAMLSAMPAWAGDNKNTTSKVAKDPNEVVCDKQEVLGSRVASKKVCMTKAEWQERTRNDQREVEALTKNVRCPNGGSC